MRINQVFRLDDGREFKTGSVLKLEVCGGCYGYGESEITGEVEYLDEKCKAIGVNGHDIDFEDIYSIEIIKL